MSALGTRPDSLSLFATLMSTAVVSAEVAVGARRGVAHHALAEHAIAGGDERGRGGERLVAPSW